MSKFAGMKGQSGGVGSANVKPTAGSTFPAFSNEDTTTEGVVPPPNTWSTCDPTSFNLRVGPDYARNKLKEPSSGSLLEIVGVE